DGKPLEPESDLEHEPGANTGGGSLVRAWAGEIYVAEDHLLGWRKLNAGRHVISFVCAGRDLRSRGYNLGLDTFVVAKVATPVDVRPPRVPSTMRELIETLRDPDPIVRGVAALALRDMRTRAQAALPALARALADPEVGVRMTAADAIARQGRAAVSV